ncbi:MAG: AbiTii domain-containing protein [Dehalococcoidia bacterium]
MPGETMQHEGLDTPEQLAASALSDVLTDLCGSGGDLKLVIRKCIQACNLLGWEEATRWLWCELQGYGVDQPVPWYRQRVPAYIDWRPYGFQEVMTKLVEEDFRGAGSKPGVLKEIRWGLDDLIRYAARGVFIPTGRHDTRWSRLDKRDVEVREVEVIENTAFQKVLSYLGDELVNGALRAYKALRLGDVAGGVWGQYRSRVDQFLTNAGLSAHIELINQGLSSPEPQAWRQAMWSCRDLLRDVAAHLWRDPHKTYTHICDDDGKPMKVTPDKYINRLAAYLHEKGITGKTGGYLRAELARLHALNDLENVAHDKDAVTLEAARLAVVGTYSVLRELVQRTDMAPVERYR